MNVFNAPLPGTTLRTITDEWKVLSGFQDLMRKRMKLEAEHLRQLRQFQEYIDPNWSRSGVWPLISPVVDLWSSQINIMEECRSVLAGIVKACPTKPSPNEPEEDITPYSRYNQLHGSYQVYQDCQTAASSREAIVEMQKWFKQNSHKGSSPDFHGDWRLDLLEALPAFDRKYRESVVAQRNSLRPIAKWHSSNLLEKLEGHVRYAEETQTCLSDYLAESSKYTSDIVKSISTAQKRLAEFSSLTFIAPSQQCFENESSHPELQPAVYLSHYLGGVPADPVLGVVSYLPKLLEMGKGHGPYDMELVVSLFLEAEKESTSFEETIQKLKVNSHFVQLDLISLAFDALSPLLPISDGAIQRYKNGIQRDEIAQLLKPFPIEACQMAATVIKKSPKYDTFRCASEWIFGSSATNRFLEDIWQKWDFDNHLPLPRGVVRTLPVWNRSVNRLEGGELIIKKTGLPYDPLK